MKIYFGGSITGGRKYLETYQKIVSYLQSAGHQVLTEHVVKPDVLELERKFTPEQIYTRDIQWLHQCDCMIAEVSNPSLGVGYEICYALRINKPVLCLYRKGIFLTRLLIGNTSKGLLVKEYELDSHWKEIIESFFHYFFPLQREKNGVLFPSEEGQK
ncbi:MAG: nucleoside 2-deoxyribosyltransferase [Candidatus Aminicenantes bacterium]|nr:MAG: nucleoside 2-deoxyribosyltransferase [Candidatus Aminicenantes bacterium]